ncbi:MAG TPA: ATP-binding cassette domain-containing protein [Pyrinomonadaceae bacterium]|jgi:ATP-binding cassette subfamily B protein|nr:ATP-binding cassette domain-containing protein [Pyrinomonadaceae bacterium]
MSKQTTEHPGEHLTTTPVSPVRLLRILFGYVEPYTARAVLLFVTLIVEGTFNTLLALALKFLIDYAITPRDARVLLLILGGLGLGFLLTAAAQVVRDYLYAWLGSRILDDIRQEMFRHFQRLSLGFYARAQMGDLLSRFSSDLAAIENAVVLGVPGALLCVINIVFSACVLFTIDWRLALGAIVGLPFCIVGPKILGPHALKAGHELRGEQATLSNIIQENLGAQQIVKAFSLRESVLGSFNEQAGRVVRLATRFNFLSYVTERSPNIGMLLFNVLLISGGSYLAFQGSLSIGSLVSFNALFIMVSSSVMGLTAVTPTLLQATGGMQRVREMLDERPTVNEPAHARTLPQLSSAVRFERVTFGYTPEQLNLIDVTMNLPARARIAFVGHSGCGKSTNLNLIMRFYDPQAGRVTFDGIDLREALLDSLYAQVGIVFQESFLFNVSVRENIRLGKLGATDAEVEEAARAAELHDIILQMHDGYETIVGERGGRLSGGQRQRIAIARALIRNPSLIILDEATSALDPATEAAINDTLERVSLGRTVISVTHRLKSIVNYDRIYVFKEGRLIEQGAHESLLQEAGAYASMWRRQTGTTVSATGDLRVTDVGILREVPLFKDLDESYLRDISEMFITERVPAGRTVISEGDEGSRFYIIIRGIVAVNATDEDGRVHRVATLDDGDYFGEIALVADIPTTASVVTVTASIFIILQREQLLKLMQQHAGLGAQVRDALARRMAETDALTA